ncbi:1-deoxy-D-xylulose-5-phosphate reductoisomerase [Spiroplasma apis]|uniref:1-deoxy-D-xylulose 5-phosphate reductoisomerase n=1 Tax=Spiroplasma apis B31 TaxID=1276258 RepID=V5RJ32_SPIAP|nr:1-deoxy-D-xylulose-5-phosphate reductoisomerase [Spiroplasma apis]AHB36554.1 1-deoxy-D-xylulose 5-phosphate reductoisomerase [Spiroplasma apis B31]
MKKLILFGASGNVGQQTIDVLTFKKTEFEIVGLSVGNNTKNLKEMIATFPNIQMIYVSQDPEKWQQEFPNVKFINDDICKLLTLKHDIVVNALSGFFGLKVTLEAIKKNSIILNANKESFVVAGDLISNLLVNHEKAKIYPLDSEHCAIFQCLDSKNKPEILYLTASGGPFRSISLEETKNVTLERALNHPNWNMGAKITIDSATMFNKAFEILEAFHLFKIKNICTLVHPESIVHSMVGYADGSIISQMSVPDMKQVINYFLEYPLRTNFEGQKNLSFQKNLSLNFSEIDQKRFPPIKMALSILGKENSKAIAMNAANEICVDYFLNNKLKFNQITEIVLQVFENTENIILNTYEDISNFDSKIRKKTIQLINEVN